MTAITTVHAANLVGVSSQYFPKLAIVYTTATGRKVKAGQVGIAYVWHKDEVHIMAEWQLQKAIIRKRPNAQQRANQRRIELRLAMQGIQRRRGIEVLR